MTRTEERLADALHAAADTVRPATLRPLTTYYPERLRGAGRPRRRHSTWLIPLTAAASVAAVIAVSVIVATRSGEGNNPGGPGLGSLAGVPSYSGTGTTPPKYYVVSRWAKSPSGKITFQVRATRTGQLRATLPPLPPGWRLVPAISAAADDHTFFLAALRGNPCAGGAAETQFYRFGVTASGRVSGFEPVGRPIGDFVGSYAVSPSGAEIAYATPPNATLLCGSRSTVPPAREPAATVTVQDVASGRIRSWRNTASSAGPSRVSISGMGPLSWTGDGRTLVINYHWAPYDGPFYTAIRALDVTGSGGSLQRHSRLLYEQGKCRVCVYQALISPDGATLTAVAMSGPRGRHAVYEQWVLQMSATGGQPLRILYKSLRPGCGNDPALYGDGSGRNWILKSGVQFGWIKDQRLVALPPGLGFKMSNTPRGCPVDQNRVPNVMDVAW